MKTYIVILDTKEKVEITGDYVSLIENNGGYGVYEVENQKLVGYIPNGYLWYEKK